ncbi:MAG TPA: TolC family protein [Clostridia bacterium]|nr:TolC family protein [Clostridia bacterium]
MKKIKWVLVLFIILIAVPTYAANAKSGREIHKLKFEDIEALMTEQSPTIRINDNTRKNLIDARDAIEDAIRDADDDREDLEDAIDEIGKAINGLNQAVNRQEALINQLLNGSLPEHENEDNGSGEAPEPEDKDILDNGSEETPKPGDEDMEGDDLDDNPGKDSDEGLDIGNQELVVGTLAETIGYVIGLYESNIATLKQNRSILEDQLEEFDKQIDKLPGQEMELDKTILQLEMVNKSTILGGQNLYLAYNNLQRQRDELVQKLELLDDQIDIMTIQEELGMVTSLDIIDIQNQREQMELGIKTLETQMDNLKGELNLMLGQDFDISLELEDTFTVDEKILSSIDYEDDLKLAKRKSYAIKLKDYDYRIKDHNLEWTRDYGNSDERRAARRDFDNARIEFDHERKNVELVFHKAYEEVQNKINAFENENKNIEYQQKKYDILELKYELGMISEIEFKQGKVEYDSQKNKAETVQQDLFQVLLQYEALLEGINFQQ